MRPCCCRRATPGIYTPDQCYLCWLPLNAVEYTTWAEPGDPTPTVRMIAPHCPHFAPHTEGERVALGLPRDRPTGVCAKGYGTADRVVSVCFRTPSGCLGCPLNPQTGD